jgi:hypothetical protein
MPTLKKIASINKFCWFGLKNPITVGLSFLVK